MMGKHYMASYFLYAQWSILMADLYLLARNNDMASDSDRWTLFARSLENHQKLARTDWIMTRNGLIICRCNIISGNRSENKRNLMLFKLKPEKLRGIGFDDIFIPPYSRCFRGNISDHKM